MFSSPSRSSTGHLDVGEGQLGGVGGAQAELVELAADAVAVSLGVHDQQRDAVAAIVRLGRRGAGADDDPIGVHAAGDERLCAVEHVVGAVGGQLGGGLHAGQVRAGARLGHGDREHDLAGDEPGQPPLLLLATSRMPSDRAGTARHAPRCRRSATPARAISSDMIA